MNKAVIIMAETDFTYSVLQNEDGLYVTLTQLKEIKFADTVQLDTQFSRAQKNVARAKML